MPAVRLLFIVGVGRCMVWRCSTGPPLFRRGFRSGSARCTVRVIVVRIILTRQRTLWGSHRSIVFGKKRRLRTSLIGSVLPFSATMTSMRRMLFSTIDRRVLSSFSFFFFVLTIAPARARGGGKGKRKRERRRVDGIRNTRGVGRRWGHHHAIKARKSHRCPFVFHG